MEPFMPIQVAIYMQQFANRIYRLDIYGNSKVESGYLEEGQTTPVTLYSACLAPDSSIFTLIEDATVAIRLHIRNNA